MVAECWHVAPVSIDYRAVGFGSYHWELLDIHGTRWFLTVDDLASKRYATHEITDAPYRRLDAALSTAADLRDAGCTFVVAPVRTRTGAVLAPLDSRFAVALYPHIDGERYPWGEFSTAAHRNGVLELIVVLHNVARPATPHARADDFNIPFRDALESSLDRDDGGPGHGPYARRPAALVVEHAPSIRRVLTHHDNLVGHVTDHRVAPSRLVLTHGEPHPANTMLTADGWCLIDWDTVLLAPPERDLWSLDPGDGSTLRAYTDATGTTLMPAALELYRIRWDLCDLAGYVARFRAPHAASMDDDKSWDELCSVVARLAG
jgi:spectinomycin phosphotransferase/16S rRNA (guanine(1405)-N(7))-methyltransferase